MSETINNENTFAIQFNGWNFGAINDWVNKTQGCYPAVFKEIMVINETVVHRNDWVVKESNDTFTIMSNGDFQERIEKTK